MSPRTTRQREVIAQIIAEAEGPLGVPEIHSRAQQALPRLGIATVYRTLKLLSEQHQIHAIAVDGESMYEKTGQGHHHHFSCERCRRVFTLHICPVDLPHGTVFAEGFRVHSHEVTLYGLCPTCAAQS
ncbi:MAG: Fur family transcriptional regulator [Deinococcus sp.]|nr:Fur family transcriptional regulator [Deinococcus sp.]